MKEGPLCRGLAAALRAGLPGSMVLKLNDRSTAGWPDVVVQWGGALWLEGKVACPGVRDTELQRLTMRRLAAVGLAYYVIWQEVPKRTLVVHPMDLGAWRERHTSSWDGHGHGPMVELARRMLGAPGGGDTR